MHSGKSAMRRRRKRSNVKGNEKAMWKGDDVEGGGGLYYRYKLKVYICEF